MSGLNLPLTQIPCSKMKAIVFFMPERCLEN